MAFSCNTDGWPIVVFTSSEEPRSDADLENHIENMRRCISRGPCFFIVDTRKGPSMTPVERKRIVSFIGMHTQTYPGHMLGVIIVVSSAIQAGIMTAIQWAVRPKWPTSSCSTLEEAWARAKSITSKSRSLGIAPAAAKKPQ